MTAVALSRPARVLRIEIKRSVVLWAVPLLAALFFFDTFRTASGLPAVWTVRSSVITSNMILDFGPFGAGLAAWVASREGRRKTGDLLATTVRPEWARQASALGATLFWLLLTFLGGVAALYIDAARVATWGGPPIWPVAVGALEVATLAVLGFTAGALFPGRFTAPLAAIGALLLCEIGYHASLTTTPGESTYALLSPSTAVPLGDDGVFYHVPPDVAIAQVMFMGGITIAVLGLLALTPMLRGPLVSAIRRTGRRLCVAGVALLATGAVASGTAFALAGTAKAGVAGWDIPALHDATSDHPIPYTPDCLGTAFKVCVHPAFSAYLGAANAAVQPAAAEIAGLPGAPVRAEQVVSGGGVRAMQGMGFAGTQVTGISGITGTPPVYTYNSDNDFAPLWGSSANANTASWRSAFQQNFLTAFVTGPPHAGPNAFVSNIPAPAQQAVVTALMTAVGSQAQFPQVNGAGPASAQTAAAKRFASLSSAARRAWLATHLSALRAGTITLAQIP